MEDEFDETESDDVVEETSARGCCDPRRDSWFMLCAGVILMNASVFLLFWNEGRHVTQLKDSELKDDVVSLQDITTIDSANEGSVVHISGSTTVSNNQILTDPLFGVSQSNAIRLWRRVETYQWIERTERIQTTTSGGSTTTVATTYETDWGLGLASNFRNPDSALYTSFFTRADRVMVGAYVLSDSVIQKMSATGQTDGDWWENIVDLSIYPLPTDVPQNIPVTLSGRYFYFGEMPVTNPRVGDTRVSFFYIPTGSTSIVATQRRDSLVLFQTDDGGADLLVEQGFSTAEEMIDDPQDDNDNNNSVLTWILRGVGCLLCFIGFMLIFQPCTASADSTPFLSDVMEMGICCVALVATALISGGVIAVAWLFCRPSVGGFIFAGLAGLGIVVFCFLWYRKLKRRGRRIEGNQGYYDETAQTDRAAQHSYTVA